MDLGRLIRNNLDRAGAIAIALVGFIAIGLGWLGVRNGLLPAQQIPYLASGAVLGIALLGVGATLWLSADLRDEWRKLDEVADELRNLKAAPPTEHAALPAAPESNGHLTAAPEPAAPEKKAPARRPARRPAKVDAD